MSDTHPRHRHPSPAADARPRPPPPVRVPLRRDARRAARASSSRRSTCPPPTPRRLYGARHRPEVAGEVEANEVDVVRHFTRLSQMNFAIDTALYSLGSCTMKHNPRINEEIARLAGFNETHPYAPVHLAQGNLELMWRLEQALTASRASRASRSSRRRAPTASSRARS